MKGLIAALVLIPCLTIADTFEYGWLPVIGVYRSTVDVDTDTLAAANVLSGLVLVNTGRNNRIWLQGQYLNLDFDGSPTHLGQSLSGFTVTALYQSQYRISRHFKPWVGDGLSFSALDYSKRFLTDSQGFLAQTIADRSETALAVDINFSVSTDWFDADDSGLAVRLSLPAGEGLSQLEAGLYITF